MTNKPKGDLDSRCQTAVEDTILSVEFMLDDMLHDRRIFDVERHCWTDRGACNVFEMVKALVKCLRIQQVEIIALCKKINNLEGKE